MTTVQSICREICLRFNLSYVSLGDMIDQHADANRQVFFLVLILQVMNTN